MMTTVSPLLTFVTQATTTTTAHTKLSEYNPTVVISVPIAVVVLATFLALVLYRVYHQYKLRRHGHTCQHGRSNKRVSINMRDLQQRKYHDDKTAGDEDYTSSPWPNVKMIQNRCSRGDNRRVDIRTYFDNAVTDERLVCQEDQTAPHQQDEGHESTLLSKYDVLYGEVVVFVQH